MKTNYFINSLVVFIVIYLVFVDSQHEPNKLSDLATQQSANLEAIDQYVPDNVSHKVYVKLMDSIQRRRLYKNGEVTVSVIRLGLFSFVKGIRCDSCSLGYDFRGNKLPVQDKDYEYYLELDGWTLNKDNRGYRIAYHVENGQSFLRKISLNKIRKYPHLLPNLSHIRQYKDYFNDKPVRFRYNTQTGAVRIPIEQSLVNLAKVFSYLIFAACIIVCFFLIAGFVKFLFDVSKGHTFTEENIRRTRWIAYGLLLFPVVQFIINLMMPIFLATYFTDEIRISATSWRGHHLFFLSGLVFLLIYKAFKQGKEEQDLTV